MAASSGESSLKPANREQEWGKPMLKISVIPLAKLGITICTSSWIPTALKEGTRPGPSTASAHFEGGVPGFREDVSRSCRGRAGGCRHRASLPPPTLAVEGRTFCFSYHPRVGASTSNKSEMVWQWKWGREVCDCTSVSLLELHPSHPH